MGNAKRVRKGYEAWNDHGIEAIFDYLDPEIEWIQDPGFPGAATYHGHDGVRQWAANLGASWDVIQVRVDRLVEKGDDVLAFLRLELRGRGSGIHMENPLAHLWTLRAGRAVRLRFYLDPAEGERAFEAR